MAKSLNLDEFEEDVKKTQGKHNKYTRFMEEAINNPEPKESKDTSKRINMAFTDENYEALQSEANRFGVNMAFYVNTLVRIVEEADIEAYIESQPIKRTKNNVARRKGNPAKRINLKFHEDTHKKLKQGAEKYNQTITQYMNVIIEVYEQDKHK